MAKSFAALRGLREKPEIDVEEFPSEGPPDISSTTAEEEADESPSRYIKDNNGAYTLATENYIQEMREIQENVLNDLQTIVGRNQMGSVNFQDGKSMKVDLTTASTILSVQGALNKNNQKKMAEALSKNAAGFMKMAKFALKQQAITVDGGLQGPATGSNRGRN